MRRRRRRLMPRLCVPACDAGTRESPLDGVNMNRAFPGDPRGTITYRIAHFVTSEILGRADVVLDIHSGGRVLRFPFCSSFHEVPDPVQQRVRILSGLRGQQVVPLAAAGRAGQGLRHIWSSPPAAQVPIKRRLAEMKTSGGVDERRCSSTSAQ